MSAHTPGPWVVEPILDHFNVYIAAEECVCVARDCTEADARLIAEAPMLLAEVRKAADTFTELARTFAMFGYPVAAEACGVAERSNRAAIAKAEGT